jgi:ionotropic glutamate receptor
MDRVKRFDFTASAWSEGFSFVVPRPEEESRLFAFIGPFQPLVKLCQILRWFTLFNFENLRFGCQFSSAFSSLSPP